MSAVDMQFLMLLTFTCVGVMGGPKASPLAKAEAKEEPHHFGVYSETLFQQTPFQTSSSNFQHYSYYQYSPFYTLPIGSIPGYSYSNFIQFHPRKLGQLYDPLLASIVRYYLETPETRTTKQVKTLPPNIRRRGRAILQGRSIFGESNFPTIFYDDTLSPDVNFKRIQMG
ncbi:UNVERIFIED_CONTAM: hypothetical protein RMT77_005777 [Armadillidium vulgare]